MMEETMTTLQTSSSHTGLARRALTRRAALAGMIGPALFAFLIVLLTLLEYDFMRGLSWHPIRESDVPWPSALALGPYGWLQVANFILFGFLLITFAIGLQRELPAKKWALVSPALLVVAGIALIFCGFKTDPHLADGPRTIQGWIHTVAFFLLLGSLIPSIFFFWRLLRKDPRWRGYDWYALISGVLALVTFPLPGVGFYISLIVMLTWIEVMALRLWVISGQSAP
jgi:hypothetical protein